MAIFSKRSLDNLIGVHPSFVMVLKESIKNTPVDFTIVEGLRTKQRQKDLYAQGRTKAGRIVTNADGERNLSNHQDEADGMIDGFGSAVDLYPFVNGSVDVNDIGNNLPKIAAHILNIGASMGIPIEWGGSWRFVDKPHFQLKKN